jgi:N-acetylglutamate synthase-like GNAT family acetyltransferase
MIAPVTRGRALPHFDTEVRLELERQRSQRPVRLAVRHAAERNITMRRATTRDAAGIHALTEQWVGDGLLLPRTLEQVNRTIRDYVIALENGKVVACGALRIYSSASAEIGALAVAAHCQGLGLGRHVVEALVEDARLLGIARVFALTMQVEFFAKVGFEPTLVAEFPEKIAADCSVCSRRSHCVEVAVARTLDTQIDAQRSA